MANQNFTDFNLKNPNYQDFLVGYNANGSAEFKTTVNSLISSFATTTALNSTSGILLRTSIYQNASGSFVTSSTLNAVSSVLLPTSVYQNASGSFVTSSTLNAASSVLLPTSIYQNASGSFVTSSTLNAASSVLLPTSVYSAASGTWQNTFTTVKNTSGSFLVSDTTVTPSASSVKNIILISQINYNNLVTKDINTLYFII